jgi:hypothetical protein
MRKNADTGSTSDRTTRVGADQAIESRTDWARVHATTPEEIERQAAQDEAEDGMIVDWDSVSSNRPPPKACSTSSSRTAEATRPRSTPSCAPTRKHRAGEGEDSLPR